MWNFMKGPLSGIKFFLHGPLIRESIFIVLEYASAFSNFSILTWMSILQSEHKVVEFLKEIGLIPSRDLVINCAKCVVIWFHDLTVLVKLDFGLFATIEETLNYEVQVLILCAMGHSMQRAKSIFNIENC